MGHGNIILGKHKQRTDSFDEGGDCPPTPLSSKSIKKSTVPSPCGVTLKTWDKVGLVERFS